MDFAVAGQKLVNVRSSRINSKLTRSRSAGATVENLALLFSSDSFMSLHPGLIFSSRSSSDVLGADEQAFRAIAVPIRQKTRYFILQIANTLLINSAIDLANRDNFQQQPL
jgi:hypothetical protein